MYNDSHMQTLRKWKMTTNLPQSTTASMEMRGNDNDMKFATDIRSTLTIPRHAHSDALLEPAVLASVPVDAKNGALLVLGAGAILDLLLDAAAEESLEGDKEKDVRSPLVLFCERGLLSLFLKLASCAFTRPLPSGKSKILSSATRRLRRYPRNNVGTHSHRHDFYNTFITATPLQRHFPDATNNSLGLQGLTGAEHFEKQPSRRSHHKYL